MKWVALAATMMLALGCAPDLQPGTESSGTGVGGAGAGGSTSSSSSTSSSTSSGSKSCVLGQGTLGNCVLGP